MGKRELLIAAWWSVFVVLVGGGFGVLLREAIDCSSLRYDVNRDGTVNVLDVQLVVNASLEEP